jgi:hypothetical protein
VGNPVQPPQTNFRLGQNQKNAGAVGVMTALSSILGGLFYDFAQGHHLEVNKEVSVILAGFAIGYVLVGMRVLWRFLGWPLFKQWYKQRFGVEPPEGD